MTSEITITVGILLSSLGFCFWLGVMVGAEWQDKWLARRAKRSKP